MKKLLKPIIITVLLALSLIVPANKKLEAATSYSHAKEFYETCNNLDGQHIELYNGYLYYATYAKLATSEQNLKYTSLGFDITLYANGKSMVISLEKGGDYLRVVDSRNYKQNGTEYEPNEKKESGSNYSLYKISYEDIKTLALAKDNSLATQILSNQRITIILDAIMTTKQYGKVHGSLSEDGKGNVKLSGTTYRLINDSELKELKKVFSTNGHTFESFYDIRQYMSNNTLTVKYKLNGGKVSNGYTSHGDMLYKGSSEYATVKKHMEDLQLISNDIINLTKIGYHLDQEKLWNNNSKYFSPNVKYSPRDIAPNIGKFSTTVTLEANWNPNKYYIEYNSNGGIGYMITDTFTYDKKGNLRNIGYTKQGYEFKEWNTKADGTGTVYKNRQEILNITDKNEGTIVLYAQWEPIVYGITTDKMLGIGGTDKFYEWFNMGFSLNKDIFGGINSISLPTKRGFSFLGYYTSIFGIGLNVVNNSGSIVIPNNQFTEDTTIYANWKAKQYTVIFDKQGGIGGTDSAKVLFGDLMPQADGPVRNGYRFLGYYTQKNGKGTQYYNEFMASDKVYEIDGDLTLYAYWDDDIEPTVNLTSNISIWTNRQIILTADASDFGSGLSSVTIYQGSKIVAEKKDLNGVVKFSLTYDNLQEGAINYKAVATDMNGNTSESFKTIYYDKTAPKGESLQNFSYSNGKLAFDIFVSDYNVQD